MDVIARTLFSLDVDSQVDHNNPFVVHASLAFTNVSLANPIIFLCSKYLVYMEVKKLTSIIPIITVL